MKLHKHILEKRSAYYTLWILLFIAFYTISPVLADDPRQTPVVKVVQDNSGSVVNISTERVVLLREYPFWGNYGSEFDLLFEQFFNTLRPAKALTLKSVGSGVIVDKTGIIVTNAHVVNMATSIFVVLKDGESVEGRVMYEDVENDLAILKIDPDKDLTQVKMAEPGDIIIGESVVAIGNPLGLENSVTLGIISGKGRSLYSSSGEIMLSNLIQTDAPINPGNSGGALLNLAGELVGINVAVVQNSQSIGFAVPVAKVQKLLESYEINRDLVVRQKKKSQSQGNLIQPRGLPGTGPQFRSDNDEGGPFSEFSKIRRQMDQMMQEMFDEHDWYGEMGGFGSSLFYDKNFDMEETGDEYIIKLDVEGLDKNKIKIEVSRGSLTVTGERSEKAENSSQNSMFKSSSFSSFTKIMPIPGDVESEAIRTEIRGDTLVIVLPKK